MPKPTDSTKHAYMFSDDMKFLQKAIIFHPTEPKFLILKRSFTSYQRPNDWDFPGGNVLFGENHDESLRREIKEETGLEVQSLKPLRVKTTFENEIYYLFITFTCRTSGYAVALSLEHTDYQWITKEDFLKLEIADFMKEAIGYLD